MSTTLKKYQTIHATSPFKDNYQQKKLDIK